MRERVGGGGRIGIAMLVALSTAVLLMASCASTRTTGEQVDDRWIHTKINAKLQSDATINAFNINVDVFNGEVTLAGTVVKEETRRRAERYAERTKGVTRVVNDIDVQENTAGGGA
jgi:osmotically-inducible protein OsmY